MKETPKTKLEGGPLNGQVFQVVFNPIARIPYFKKKTNDWNDVIFVQYLLSEEKKKGRNFRIAKYAGEEK